MTDGAELGGDPACWAHLVEDDGLVVADLSDQLHGAGDGVHWTLTPDSDVNANLVRLEPHHSMAEHRNDAVDVLIVTLAGSGTLVAGTRRGRLAPHVVAHVPKGSSRSIEAGPDGLTYLTVHRRRPGIEISVR